MTSTEKEKREKENIYGDNQLLTKLFTRLAGVPPVGVKLDAYCWQTNSTAGDAGCTFDCVSVTAANGTAFYPVVILLSPRPAQKGENSKCPPLGLSSSFKQQHDHLRHRASLDQRQISLKLDGRPQDVYKLYKWPENFARRCWRCCKSPRVGYSLAVPGICGIGQLSALIEII